MHGTGSLRSLYERYSDDVQFISIYIREAHPVDGWYLGSGISGLALRVSGMKAATDVYDPSTMDERRTVAGSCEDALRYGIPTLVDEMDDAVNSTYAAWPTRLYLIGEDGRVVYKGGLGPWGFSPKTLGREIEKHLVERVSVS